MMEHEYSSFIHDQSIIQDGNIYIALLYDIVFVLIPILCYRTTLQSIESLLESNDCHGYAELSSYTNLAMKLDLICDRIFRN